jgi:transposase-like protein
MLSTDEPLSGVIEIDETFVGGKAEHGSKARGTKGGTKHKTMIIGAVQRGGDVRLMVAPQGSTRFRKQFLKNVVSDEATAIYTDGHPAFRGLNDPRHETVDHSEDEWVRGDVSTNGVEGVWSLFKRSIVGSYHQLSVKHLPAYVDEFEFRFNNRKNHFLFRDTLVALIKGDTLTYDELIQG